MKLATAEELDAHARVTTIGAAKGVAGGLAFALPLSYIANKRWAYYRSLTPALKSLAVVLIVLPTFAISAERAGLQFERQQWAGAGKEAMESEEAKEFARWEALSPMQKAGDWASRHEYSVILGSWSTAMVGAFGYIMRDPHQSMGQKIVQARMWAQGLTVGVMIAAGAIAHANRAKVEASRGVDHSWRAIIEAEQKAKSTHV
ncbi:hypothetical protein JAAARDRAFT_52163 [Jaapia argillacea MUCL 33604]|uniref:HIG1 domain-containing protein n=1 Tax=Jaapia argillacea MUCL 33604 TaxID=933084 RepID=A0A067QNG7_9AGAM|nr:hypothetical protein JAAARDRAFT_52163 [Jaapia argillacea MUCL 33604]